MPDETYLFIDGEYLRQVHRQVMQKFFHEDGDLQVKTLEQEAGASRAYFYDSLDDAPRPGESEAVCQARIKPLVDFFGRVQSLEGFHVRQGSMTGQGKRRRQKEVDILLAVDMLTHGFNGSMQKAILLTGDLDFRPIIEALVRQGVFVHVWYHRSSIARDLPGAADFGHEIRFRQLYDWNTRAFKEIHPIPSEHWQGGDRGGHLTKSGAVAGYRAELYEHPAPAGSSNFWLWIDFEQHNSLVIRDTDNGLIERYATIQYGPIEWQTVAPPRRAISRPGN